MGKSFKKNLMSNKKQRVILHFKFIQYKLDGLPRLDSTFWSSGKLATPRSDFLNLSLLRGSINKGDFWNTVTLTNDSGQFTSTKTRINRWSFKIHASLDKNHPSKFLCTSLVESWETDDVVGRILWPWRLLELIIRYCSVHLARQHPQ